MSDKKPDRDLFRSGHLQRKTIVDLPSVVKEYCRKKNFATRWLHKKTLEAHAGYDDRGWQPLTLPKEFQPKRVPGEYTEGFDVKQDGTLQREDIILCIMPQTMADRRHKEALSDHQDFLKTRIHAAREKGMTASGSLSRMKKPTEGDLLDEE